LGVFLFQKILLSLLYKKLKQKSMEQPLIIVCYVNVGNLAIDEINHFMRDVMKRFETKPEENIRQYFLPTREESKIECINPIRIPDDEYKKIEEKLEEARKKLDDFFKEMEEKKNG
jgi:polyhydroxyalkanoate synthesis regulator phasin